MLISINNTIKCTKFTFNLIILWYFIRPKWNKCDEIKYTLYNFYNNFLETLQSLFCITKLKYFLHSSSFPYLLVSSYILEEKKKTKCALSVPSKHQSPYISVSLILHLTNLWNTSKSHFKLHATNSGNFMNIFTFFKVI